MKKIIFVCTGNICRSPTAQGVFEKMARDDPLLQNWVAESRGTHGSVIGSPPHPETMRVAAAKGYDLSHIRSEQLSLKDFEEADYLYAMSVDHHDFMRSLAPAKYHKKIRLFMDYMPKLAGLERDKNTPDPLGEGLRSHQLVLELIEQTIPEIIASLKLSVKK